ncbi:hypothetical protein SAMN05443572_109277 [Myxococcus fulvus]|uniref:Uncharacterized protein n=1 Tax=Myxococcus fulvus TaxID=33 RepID=A0A511T637_MYXFU|nr:hypothetical protein [Myxococcus fulvus]GEN09625.1 hypothetical protein MFU01_46620 [Myxococcus fulvus]SEU33363.1 hypothetical protein SAMN05443572_109277 [Myxococcus fulvus]
MHDPLRDEVLGLLAPHLDITHGATFEVLPKRGGILDAFPDLERRRQTLSHMGLTEAKQAGIVMYGDASFSIDVYGMERLPSFAHFVASVIVHRTQGTRLLRGLELNAFVPEKGWKTLFGTFAKGVNANNIFSGKRLGPPSRACTVLSTGNEQLYALECPGTYATLFLQTS